MKTEDGTTPSAVAVPRDALHNLCLADPLWSERYSGWAELGHGGTATVVRTRSQATGDEIALKVFPHLTADEWRRYHDEVRNAQRLSSPYIVRTYSPFPRSTFAWIEMEWVEGRNLRHELESAPLPFPVTRALAVAAAVARALSTAHAEGVVHRDVKPANILLPASGRPVAKLGDFGLSRLTGGARLTRTGLFVGTPQFAAPEVIDGRTAEPASDVYALCLCLYLMLSGNQTPFDITDETSPTQWIRAHTSQVPRPIRSWNPEAPDEVAALLEQGLDKLPERRPPAATLVEVLERLAGEELAPPGSPRPAPSLGPWPIAVGVIVAAALVATLVRDRNPAVAARPTTLLPASAAPVVERKPGAPRPENAPSALPMAVDSATAAPLPADATASVPAAAPTFTAELRKGVLVMRNGEAEPAIGIRITIVAGGTRYVATPPETLNAGEDLYLAAEEFRPPLPESLREATISIAARFGSAPRTAVIRPR